MTSTIIQQVVVTNTLEPFQIQNQQFVLCIMYGNQISPSSRLLCQRFAARSAGTTQQSHELTGKNKLTSSLIASASPFARVVTILDGRRRRVCVREVTERARMFGCCTRLTNADGQSPPQVIHPRGRQMTFGRTQSSSAGFVFVWVMLSRSPPPCVLRNFRRLHHHVHMIDFKMFAKCWVGQQRERKKHASKYATMRLYL